MTTPPEPLALLTAAAPWDSWILENKATENEDVPFSLFDWIEKLAMKPT